jgi:hypothetical protein
MQAPLSQKAPIVVPDQSTIPLTRPLVSGKQL